MHKIRRVAMLSTGTVSIHPEHVARSGSPELWWLLTSRQWTTPRPINVYVIEHETGLILFDTGQDRASVTDPAYFPKGMIGHIYGRLARFQIMADQTLTAQLRKLGYDIANVRTVVISHLHQDHIGGLSELGHADIIVASDELDAAKVKRAELSGYLKNHIFLPGLRWKPVQGVVDLVGDGSIMILPTPGHTPGSMSMLVLRDEMVPLLFVGDLTYDVSLLEKGHVPGVGERSGLEDSTRYVAELKRKHPGLVVLAAHDPAAAALLASATGY
jgi:glyoxylase-like metal-dependent hydrolase (beta-lactamase superfamily II)